MAKKNAFRKTNRKKMLWTIVAVVIVCAIAATCVLLYRKNKNGPTDYVAIDVENYGVITAELYGNIAPVTVDNFLKLVDDGFYDGLTFHRIISGFMIQGGDPEGNGTGGSGANIKGEFSANGVENNISHTRGVLSMARSQAYDSASSQFFIMHADASYLDGQYAAFGRVVSGMDVVDAICDSTPVTDGNGSVDAADQPRITSIRRIEQP